MPRVGRGQGPRGEDRRSALSLTHAGQLGVPANALQPPRGRPGGQIYGGGHVYVGLLSWCSLSVFSTKLKNQQAGNYTLFSLQFLIHVCYDVAGPQ